MEKDQTFSKTVSVILLLIVLVGALILTFDVQSSKADTFVVIVINEDGSTDHPTAPITTTDNITYTFTDNINGSIISYRSNTVIDGAGYVLEGFGISLAGQGTYAQIIENVTIKNVTIIGKVGGQGILLEQATNCTIIGNNIVTDNMSISTGIMLRNSAYNSIIENNLTGNNGGVGIDFYSVDSPDSSNNMVIGNNITNYLFGLLLYYSENNRFIHNSVVNNKYQVICFSPNIWDDGYPSGGNYWSDYNGTDHYSGPYQNITGRDEIGDTPYIIDTKNIDNYPLKPATQLTLSDANNDGIVNMKDVMTFIYAFNSCSGQPRWNSAYDLNHDNRIDLRDIVICVLNFGRSV